MTDFVTRSIVLVNPESVLYPVPQNAPHVPARALAGGSAGMNVLDFPEGPCPKATDVSPWYGVYKRNLFSAPLLVTGVQL